MVESKTFCVRAFNHLQVKNNGYLRFCCDAKPGYIYSEDGRILRANSASAEDIGKSPTLKKIRNQMLGGEKPQECSKCWDIESAGGRSLRQKENDGWLHRNFQQDSLQYVELRMGNLCNLKCRMCGPGDSSKWYDDYYKMYGTTKFNDYGSQVDFLKDKDLFKWHEEPEMLSWLLRLAPEIREIQLVGGEPFLSNSHIPLLKALIESGRSKHISLRYTTNLTHLSEEYFHLWKQFQEVTLSVSIDGIGEIYEYIRFPAKWAAVEGNLKRLDLAIGDSVNRVSIQPTPNIYNIHHLLTLADWVQANCRAIGWTAHLNFQEHPAWQSATILDEDERVKLSSSFLHYATSLMNESSERELRISSWFRGLSTRLLSTDLTHLKSEFIKKNKRLDSIRGQNLESFNPVLFQSLNRE